jgi:hypothetical protein
MNFKCLVQRHYPFETTFQHPYLSFSKTQDCAKSSQRLSYVCMYKEMKTLRRLRLWALFWIYPNSVKILTQFDTYNFLSIVVYLEILKVWALSLFCIDCTSDCISSTDPHLTILIELVCDKSFAESFSIGSLLSCELEHLEISFLVIEYVKSLT